MLFQINNQKIKLIDLKKINLNQNNLVDILIKFFQLINIFINITTIKNYIKFKKSKN